MSLTSCQVATSQTRHNEMFSDEQNVDDECNDLIPPGVSHQTFNGTLILANSNTTIGYCLFSKENCVIEYIFVSPSFRRRGYGRYLVVLCERECGCQLMPQPPFSGLGLAFIRALHKERGSRRAIS